jgi:hypothetical protein
MTVERRVHARNHGLARISRMTSWAVGGGLVLSGGFAVLAANSFAGQSRSGIGTAAANPALGLGTTPVTVAPSPVGSNEGDDNGEAPQTTPTTMPHTAQATPQSVPSTPQTAATPPTYAAPVYTPYTYNPPPMTNSGGS